MTNEMTNNFYMDEDINTQCPHIVSILKAHPIHESLTRTAFVPEIYIYQLWESIKFIKETPTRPEHFKFKLIAGGFQYSFRFDLQFFRTTIGFPEQGQNDFDEVPDENELVRAINDLGYEIPFAKTKDFKRKYLSRMWCVLYSILNRCLSPSNTGMDSINKPLMKILYGVAYHRHIDFAAVVWNQMIKLVNGKNNQKRNYIPFIRFFAIILNWYMDTHVELAKFLNEQIVRLHMMKTVQTNTGSVNVPPRPISDSLLQLADPNDPAIRAYRELNAPMEPAQPQEPAEGAHRDAGEGSSRQGLKRKKKEGKKIEGVRLVVVREAEGRQKLAHDQPDLAPTSLLMPTSLNTSISNPYEILSDSPSAPKTKRRKSVARCHTSRERDSESTESDAEETQPSSPVVQDVSASRPFESDPMITPESLPISSGNDDSARDFSDTAFDFETFEFGVQGGNEGGVEKSKESERSGSEKGSKENEDPPQPTPKCRDDTFAIEVHVLNQGIEKDGSTQLSHAQSFQRHSDSSQKELVLFSHGDEPRLLSPSHLETSDIETRSIPPQLLTSLYALNRTNIRTLTLESSLRGLAHLRGVAGTRIETAFYVDSQGFLGNPTNVNITPALNVGLLPLVHEVPRYECLGDTALVPPQVGVSGQPGSLSDPVSDLPPFHLSPDMQDMINRFAQSHASPASSPVTPTLPIIPSTTIVSSHQQFYTTSPQTSQFASFSQSHQSQSQSASFAFNNLSLNDMQIVFHAILLSSSNLTTIQTALLAILNTSPQTSSSPDLSAVHSRLDAFASQFESLNKHLTFIEETCRPSSLSSSSRHDDPDSDDRHEGENRTYIKEQYNEKYGEDDSGNVSKTCSR